MSLEISLVSDPLICHVIFKLSENERRGWWSLFEDRQTRNVQVDRSKVTGCVSSSVFLRFYILPLPVVFVRAWFKHACSLSMVTNQSAHHDPRPLTPTRPFPPLNSSLEILSFFSFFRDAEKVACDSQEIKTVLTFLSIPAFFSVFFPIPFITSY